MHNHAKSDIQELYYVFLHAMTLMLVITMYFVQLWRTLFYSLSRNKIGDDGATTLANALAVNRNLKTLK